MASPKQSRGVGPPDPMDIAALQPQPVLHGEREGAVALGPAAPVAAAASRLWSKAFLVLAICISAAALLCSLGSLAAPSGAPPASLPPSRTWLGLQSSQGGARDDLMATHGNLLEYQYGMMGSARTPGSFSEDEDVIPGNDAKGQSSGIPTTTAQTSRQGQPGSGRGLGTVVAVTLSPAPWLGTRVPATSAQLLQTVGDSRSSQHHLGLGSLPGIGPGSHKAVQVPAVTLARGLEQPADAAEPRSAGWGAEGTRAEPAAWVPATPPARWQLPSLPTAASGPLLEVVATQRVSLDEVAVDTPVPPRAPTPAEVMWTPMGTPSQSHSTVDQPGGDQMLALEASSDRRITDCSAVLSPAVSSKPSAVVPASNLPAQPRAVTAAQTPGSTSASDPSTASDFSDVQHRASTAGATTRSCNGQKEAARPSPGPSGDEDHTPSPHLVSLVGVPSALPSERTSSLTQTQPGAGCAPSAVTPEMLWNTRPADTFLYSKDALLVDTVLTKDLGNGSGLLAAALASPPPASASTHGVNHLQELPPFLPAAESEEPAVTSQKLSDLSSPQTEQTLTPSKAHPSAVPTRAPNTAGPAVTEVSSPAPAAIPEHGMIQAPCKNGAATVASPSLRAAGVTHAFLLGSSTQRPSLHPNPFLTTPSEDRPTVGQHQAVSVLPGQVAMEEEAGNSEPRTASAGSTATPAGPPGPTHASPVSVPPHSSKNCAPELCSEAVHRTNLPSPSYLLTSTGAVPTASSSPSDRPLTAPAGETPNAQSTSGHSVTSQHPSTAGEHLPTAAAETFTLGELMTMGNPGSPGMKPTGLPTLAHPLPAWVLPLQFRLLGIAYTKALSCKSSGSYRELEEEVMMMLNQTLSTYETFLQAKVLEFMNGSVVVRGEVLFQRDVPAPTNSHLIRTVITEASRGNSTFSWQLEPRSVQSSGFSLENLDPEKLSISLTAFQLGRSGTDSLQRLISEVVQLLSALYHVRNFTIARLRNINGNVEITGDIYLDTVIHADVEEVLQALTALANFSVDLTSLSVEGARLHLQVYPLSFLIVNRHFSEDLLDPLTIQHQELTRDLGHAVGMAGGRGRGPPEVLRTTEGRGTALGLS
ncbi:mucin-1 [Cuculus canorus]|uniref:mucin-1 n=1 Tax=Cuculus canorus TaxID=55661 RepID=UPI0023AADF08|nr:mucin-1 [Cuculus canorus]